MYSHLACFSPCVQAGSDAEGPGALLAAAVQCRAAKALRTLLTLPSNCTAFVGMGACMQRLPKLLLSGTSGSQQLSSVLVRILPVPCFHVSCTLCIRHRFITAKPCSELKPRIMGTEVSNLDVLWVIGADVFLFAGGCAGCQQWGGVGAVVECTGATVHAAFVQAALEAPSRV